MAVRWVGALVDRASPTPTTDRLSAPESARMTEPSAVAGPSGRLLVIEDDASLRRILRSALERAGHRVDDAADGLVGAEKLGSGGYEVVLLDIGLPFIDGWRLLDTLEGRRQPAGILLSGRGDEPGKVRARRVGG